MKKFVSILLMFTVIFSFVGCSNTEKSENNEVENSTQSQSQSESKENSFKNKSKVLIAYFSRAGENYGVGTVEKGNTRVLAETIANNLSNADMFEIANVNPYPENYDEATEAAKQEQKENARPKLTAEVGNFDDYDTVFIGYPIWWLAS